MVAARARYWILTIPAHSFTPFLPAGLAYIKGQLELAASGFLHWQLVAVWTAAVRLATVRDVFGEHHAEATRSEAALAYVWKEETRVQGTQFELGKLAMKRNSSTDWDNVRALAVAGDFSEVPSDVYVRCYNQLKRIAADHLQPKALFREVNCYWGRSGVGKTRRAYEEALGLAGEGGARAVYWKDATSKWWDGYQGQDLVIIDEFRGGIALDLMLRWLDRYPVVVECKGSSIPLVASRIWVTSNLVPRLWYPDLDIATQCALMRRMNVVEIERMGLE
nr:MAG: replication associated protein [Cressdnaviricota sp.]